MDERNTATDERQPERAGPGWGQAPSFAPPPHPMGPPLQVVGATHPALRIAYPIGGFALLALIFVLLAPNEEIGSTIGRSLLLLAGIVMVSVGMRSRIEIGPDWVRVVRGFREETVARAAIAGIRPFGGKDQPARLLLAPGTVVSRRTALIAGSHPTTESADALAISSKWAEPLGRALAFDPPENRPRPASDGVFRTADGHIKTTAYVYGVVMFLLIMLAIIGMVASP